MTEPTVVKVSGLSGVVSVVPNMLGFTPTESLVLMKLEGPRRRITFTMRCDLPAAEEEAEMAAQMLARLDRVEATEVLLVIYTDDAEPFPRKGLVDAIRKGVSVADALLVRNDRLWSYLCRDDGCCPPEGKPIVENDAVTAAFALRGVAPLPSRDAAVQSVAAPVDATDVLAALTSATLDDVTDPARFADPRAEMSAAEVASWTLALEDVDIRDGLLRQLLGDKQEEIENMLRYLASRVPAGHDAAVCTCAAIAAYLNGNGMTAQALLDRALSTDPRYAMALLLATTLDNQIPPSALRAILSQP